MASNGGGIGRFARRKTDAPTKAPPASTETSNEGGGRAPMSDFPAFARGIASPKHNAFYDNVGMFGESFDFGNDYTTSDLDGFGMPETPQEGNAGSNDDVNGVDSTTEHEESARTPVTSNKKTGGGEGAFQFRNNHGTNPASHVSPPRPKTAVPPQQTVGVSGLSLFARKRAATSQELTQETAPVVRHAVVNNDNNIQSSLKPADVSATNDSATEVDANNDTESTFTRVLSPPSIAPSKPIQTQGIGIPSVTPKASSTKNVFLPQLNDNEDDFATPAMQRSVSTQASIVQKTGTVAETTTTFVTPESNVTTHQDSAMQDSYPAEQQDAKGFDDLLSLFLGDLRCATDLEQHGQAELLDLEVDLSRAFARTLRDRSTAMDVLDSMEDAHLQADDLIAVMQQF